MLSSSKLQSYLPIRNFDSNRMFNHPSEVWCPFHCMFLCWNNGEVAVATSGTWSAIWVSNPFRPNGKQEKAWVGVGGMWCYEWWCAVMWCDMLWCDIKWNDVQYYGMITMDDVWWLPSKCRMSLPHMTPCCFFILTPLLFLSWLSRLSFSDNDNEGGISI